MKKTIFLLENNRAVRSAATRALRQSGFKVHSFSEIEPFTSYRETAGHQPDLYILDFDLVDLPFLHTHHFFATTHYLPLVLTTASLEKKTELLTLLACQPVLIKPFDLQELLTAVSSALGG
ncbi:MAG TPA: response regulator [Chloroflexia bacterium]|nr:response regulator [Chloroflexia bacterium]